jgi:hypothetical protein
MVSRAADDEAVKNIFGESVFGARVSPGHSSGNDRFENERQLLASIGPLVSGLYLICTDVVLELCFCFGALSEVVGLLLLVALCQSSVD